MDKKKRKNYSPRKLEKALSDIRSGKYTPLEASRQYVIPRSTLVSKATGVRPEKISKPGPKCMLGEVNEQKILDWLVDCGKRGIPLTKQGLLFTAKKLFEEGHGINIVNTFDAEKGPGRRWFLGFMERHRQVLSMRTAEYLHKCRSVATENSIRKWFTEIADFLGEESLIFADGNRVFKCDETSILIHPKSLPVIVQRGQRNVYDLSASCNKENITIFITANANGTIAPPLALFKFERIPAVISAAAPASWGIGRSPNGWMTCESFFEYITNVFHPFLIRSGVKLPIILVMDGHKSHASLQTSEFCAQNGIILIALPPNCTHILQPLDVSFFGPMKLNWRKELDLYKLKTGKEIQKQNIPSLVDNILAKSEFKKNLQSGFKRCGLSPFDPNAVDYSKCFDKKQSLANGDQQSTLGDENNLISNETFLQKLENEIPASLLHDFQKSSSFWDGPIEMKGLFHFWRAAVHNNDFQTLMDSDRSEIDFSELENFDLYPTHQGIALDEGNFVLNEECILVEEEDFVMHKDVVSIELAQTEKITQNAQEQVQNTVENDPVETPEKNHDEKEFTDPQIGLKTLASNAHSTKLIRNSVENDPVETPEKNHDEKESTDPQIGLKTPASNARSTKLIRNSAENDRVETLDKNRSEKESTDPQIGLKTPASNARSKTPASDARSKTPASDTRSKTPDSDSNSSVKSVEEILNSVVRYTNAPSSKVEPSARKKLDLPSVMTSENWINLKRASDKEKEDAEKLKNDRKEQREKEKEDKEKLKNDKKDQREKKEKLKNELKEQREKRREAIRLKKTKTPLRSIQTQLRTNKQLRTSNARLRIKQSSGDEKDQNEAVLRMATRQLKNKRSVKTRSQK